MRAHAPRLASRARALDTPTRREVGVLGDDARIERERQRGGSGETVGRDGLKFHNPAVSDTLG